MFHLMWNLDYPNSYSLELPVRFFYNYIVFMYCIFTSKNTFFFIPVRTLHDCLGHVKFEWSAFMNILRSH